jgi:hypothetical protein
MSEPATQAAEDMPKPARRRGRPVGARDSKPRTRRSKNAPADPKPARKVRESDIQKQFLKWLDTVPAPGVPGAKLGDFTYAVPNGIWIPGDLQTRIRIIMQQRQLGMKKGVPDVNIALPLHGYHGCFIELKRETFRANSDSRAPVESAMPEEQITWLTRLRAAGYFCELCAGIQEATACVRRYLDGEKPLPFPWE